MNDLPLPIYLTKQECLIATIVYFPIVAPYGRLHFSVNDGPCEIAFKMNFCV